jgi:hypothetical protein
MQLPKYPYKINESYLDYEFISKGPNGRIKKIIHFDKIGENIFNIGFGDLDETTGQLSDIVVTNNNDSRIVLATVASAIHDFMLHYPNAIIYARGSTAARTRLYRIEITNQWKEISVHFNIYDLKDLKWEKFITGTAYEAFLIQWK